ncbi:class I SAM-dependent methyltransferase [Candidatus Nitrospira neomarina]|uniref:Class I SAM-dependent methyltransferase n=1 Tax=Candidatus Nitrospira neomarina TaxID=3020899 RepID=A0AA96GH76_9BACT|nr:class I SAM-dependent methyltransferase [Candidatus Nitrospira neomarina]WNM60992.1 class I SAM-dependent methyltransferase [Candidatus Nitrospira neomarina]
MKRGWYARRVFPRLVHWSMGQAGFVPFRQALVAKASGMVLEIGFGSGANFSYYSSQIHSLTAIDPNPGMIPLARSLQAEAVIPVHLALALAEALPFPSACFDTVVSTMTLCSVPQLSKALQELHRVVRPGGQLLFLEHGQSPDRWVRRWQDGLTPAWKHLGDGCHLNRPMIQMIQAQGWTVSALENFYLPGVPKPFAYFSQGMAVKA